MKKRVVITGLGAVTPIGNTVEEFWANIRKGEVGIAPITKFDVSDYKVKLAAEVKDLWQRNVWILKLQKGWKPSHSMQLQRQRKHLKMQDFIWKRKTRFVPV